MRHNRSAILGLTLVLLVAVLAGCTTAPAWRRAEQTTFLPGVAERAVTEIDAALLRMGAAPAEVRRDERQQTAALDQPVPVTWSRWTFSLIAFPTFRKLSPEDYANAVREGAKLAGAEVVVSSGGTGVPLRLLVRVPVKAGGKRFKVEALDITIRRPEGETVAVTPPQGARPRPVPASEGEAPRVALIVDDWGYEQAFASDFFSLPVPLTMAVIPFLSASERLAKAGQAHGWEVILHLPMEAEKHEFESTQGLIRVDMSDDEIRAATDRALAAVPQADGVNNHMGSLATQNTRVMQTVLEEVSRRNLFFVDSRTSPASVAANLAKARGVAFGENALFLDNKKSVDYTRAQLRSLVAAAKVYGYAIGIGHVRRETLSAFQLELPELIREGVQFVAAREVVGTDFRRPVRFGEPGRPATPVQPASPTGPASPAAPAPQSPRPTGAPAPAPATAPAVRPPAPQTNPPKETPPAPAPQPAPATSAPSVAAPAAAPVSVPAAPAPAAPASAPSRETVAPQAGVNVPETSPAPPVAPVPQSTAPAEPTQEL